MDMSMDITVVVATYNRRAGLERLLRSLAEQTYPADRFEVVVVDDGSTDGTPGLLGSIAVPYALRSFSQPNSGPAAARNLGVEQARGSLIVFLDDDVVPVPGLLVAHEAAHGYTTSHVVTGPMLPPPPDWSQPAWDRWDAEQLRKQYEAMLSGQFECSQRQFFTANASVHRHLFQAAGGFDTRFKRAEDMELAWQMSRHGARFVFEPSAEVVHYAARPFISWCRNAYQYGSYDVIMEREKAIPAFALACREFHHRRAINRWLTRACVGRSLIRDAALFGLSTAVLAGDRLGVRRVTSFALSSIFNVRYWQGASDELGGSMRLWSAIEARGAPVLQAVANDSAHAAVGPGAPGGASSVDVAFG
jgi:glycosyltransferase involved in cell wall biosynthesis